MPRRLGAALVLAALALLSCGKSANPQASPGVRPAPNIAGFLRLSVATPRACTTQDASTFQQRRSPWVGTVDISVYLEPKAPPAAVKRIGRLLRRAAIIEHVYYESATDAFKEFQRTYTCWTQVPRSQIPPSYRAVLLPTATISQRNALVASLVRQDGVDSASCDPALPCTDVVRSAKP